MSRNREIGLRGEQLAADFFIDHGYRIRDRNWRIALGEIDLIIERDQELRFIEVKTRTSLMAGYPEESVTESKLKRLNALAHAYLDQFPELGNDYHLDVVSIMIDDQGSFTIEYLSDISIS